MNEEKETARIGDPADEADIEDTAPEQTDTDGTDAEQTDTDAETYAETDAETDTEDAVVAPAFSLPVRIALCTLTLILTLAIAGYAALFIALKGPSDAHRESTVTWLRGNAVGRVLISTVMSESEIAECENAKAAREALDSAEAEALRVEINTSVPTLGELTRPEQNKENPPELVAEDDDGIEIITIKTESYKGTLMIVDDPKRIFVGVPEKYGNYAYGLKLRDMIRKYDAVGGINAGGFIVVGDVQTGGKPMGFVIKDSKVLWAGDGSADNICGFDKDGKLIVGTMSPAQAVKAGVVDAVSFGPALIIDGKPVNTGHWLGVERNARTAIGQRADGAMLLLVIEGRHIASFGAYFTDVIDIMLEYGAVNATNLDGGYSTFMVNDEEGLNMKSYAYGERYLPTSILIRKK